MKPDKAFWLLAIAGLVAVSACDQAAAPTPKSEADEQRGWTRPPQVQSASVAGAVLTVSGRAQPGARVVFRRVTGRETGGAYAAAADQAGHFTLRVTLDRTPVIFRPETQMGQESAPAPDRLAVTPGPDGVVALLRSGRPAIRLSRVPSLDAVDVNGQSALLSGRSKDAVAIKIGDRSVIVNPNTRGRWSLLAQTSELGTLNVAGDAYVWPGPALATEPEDLARTGRGWRIGWTGEGGARQTTWLPD